MSGNKGLKTSGATTKERTSLSLPTETIQRLRKFVYERKAEGKSISIIGEATKAVESYLTKAERKAQREDSV